MNKVCLDGTLIEILMGYFSAQVLQDDLKKFKCGISGRFLEMDLRVFPL
jgi:hypothetical protein